MQTEDTAYLRPKSQNGREILTQQQQRRIDRTFKALVIAMYALAALVLIVGISNGLYVVPGFNFCLILWHNTRAAMFVFGSMGAMDRAVNASATWV